MIQSNQELFKAADGFILRLKKAGDNNWAGRIHDALRTSTLPGEILGELRFQLREIAKTPIIGKTQSEREVKEMLDYIGTVI